MNILLVGERGNESSSKLLLDLITPKYFINKLYLMNELKWDKEQLISFMSHKVYDYVLLFGNHRSNRTQAPIEFVMNADKQSKKYKTNYEHEKFVTYLEEQHMAISISEQTSQMYENEIYYTSLEQIYKNSVSTKCIMLILPPIENMDSLKLSYHIIRFFTQQISMPK